MKGKKWFFILGGVVVLLIVIAIIKGKTSQKGIEVSVEKVAKKTIVETVAASGKIQPETEVIISSDVSGEIVEMSVREGDQVKTGDLLLKINPDLVESALSRAEASLNTSRANLSGAKARLQQSESQFTNAKASFNRNEELYKNKVISDAEYDQAKANYYVAEAEVTAAKESVQAAKFNVESAEATLNEAKENLGRTSIYSPMSGTITKLNKESGERVVGTAQMAGTEIMTVADLSVMEVAVEVNENDIVRVTLGDTSSIEVDAYLGEDFIGVVTEIANSANITGASADQVTNFDVKIRILPGSYSELDENEGNSNSPFRPGMSATVDIQTNTSTSVLAVPIQAVTTRKDTTENQDEESIVEESDLDEMNEVVFVLDSGIAKQKTVKTGIQNTMYIEIIDGLEVGDEVIIAPYAVVSKRLQDGDQVKSVDKKELYSRNKD
ncbi:MAG: efflux RND transporter periplasmic adaptor subunit [Vicingaceae bacterium]